MLTQWRVRGTKNFTLPKEIWKSGCILKLVDGYVFLKYNIHIRIIVVLLCFIVISRILTGQVARAFFRSNKNQRDKTFRIF